jgi:hypothetical protein
VENLDQHIALLFIPMILGNSFHMALVKMKLLVGLAVPISVKLFGANKTLRGFLLLPVLSGLIALMGSAVSGPYGDSIYHDGILGAGMGIAYLLGELPNSFVKRRLGIANGEHSKKYKGLQIIIDRADSLIAIFIYYYFVTEIPALDCLILFLSAMVIAFATSVILYWLKIKSSI